MAMMKRSLCEVCGLRPAIAAGVCDCCADIEPPDEYGRMTEDERLDDPRHGQAEAINRERHEPQRSDDGNV